MSEKGSTLSNPRNEGARVLRKRTPINYNEDAAAKANISEGYSYLENIESKRPAREKKDRPPRVKPVEEPAPDDTPTPAELPASVLNTSRQEAEETYRPARRNFPTRMVIVSKKDSTWGADIADMKKWEADNDGYNNILTVIDIFTRYAWAVPLKGKSATVVTEAFDKIINNPRDGHTKPMHLWTDKGGEFLNKQMDAWRKTNDITIYHTYGTGKSAIVERFNRTLKTIMWRELAAIDSNEWVSMLPRLLEEYNNTPHGSLKVTLTPSQAGVHDALVRQIWRVAAQKREDDDTSKQKFFPGDQVRLSHAKDRFGKGYEQSWTTEVFKVKTVHQTAPITYTVEDDKGEELEGTFYNEELSPTHLTSKHIIDYVVREEGDKSLVKWLGLPKNQNSWVPTASIEK